MVDLLSNLSKHRIYRHFLFHVEDSLFSVSKVRARIKSPGRKNWKSLNDNCQAKEISCFGPGENRVLGSVSTLGNVESWPTSNCHKNYAYPVVLWNFKLHLTDVTYYFNQDSVISDMTQIQQQQKNGVEVLPKNVEILCRILTLKTESEREEGITRYCWSTIMMIKTITVLGRRQESTVVGRRPVCWLFCIVL